MSSAHTLFTQALLSLSFWSLLSHSTIRTPLSNSASPGRHCLLSGCAERGKNVPPFTPPPRFSGLPRRAGKLSRLQPEPAAATWVGREGTGAGKAGPGEGGGADSRELGRRGK